MGAPRTPPPPHSSTAIDSRDAETTRGAVTGEWIKKTWSGHAVGQYSAFRKKAVVQRVTDRLGEP